MRYPSLRWLPILLLVVVHRASAAAPPATAPADVNAICAKHEALIRQHIAAGQYAEAILASAEYESGLRAAYSVPVINQGAFRSDAHRLTFNIPFAKDFKSSPTEGVKEFASATSAGIEFIALLDSGEPEAQRVMVMAMDVDMLMRRMGFGNPDNTVAALQTAARQMAAQLGTPQNERIVKVAGSDSIRMELAAEGATEMTTARNGGRIYFFINAAPAPQKAQNSANMDQWIASIRFSDPDPAQVAKVTAVREKIPKAAPGAVAAPEPLLVSVREMAELGAVRDAVLQIADLRSALAASMPKPVIVGDRLTYDSYGVSLKNPDANRWKSTIQPAGSSSFLVLEDKNAVVPGMVGVMIMDPILLFGTGVQDSLGPDAPEEAARGMISSMGRGSLLNTGTNLEKEQFRQFKGRRAYEGIVTSHVPGAKTKNIVILGSRAVYLAVVLGAPDRLAEYESILDAGLELKDASPTPAPAAPTSEGPKR